MGWVLVLGLLVCAAFAPLRLVVKADLDTARWRIDLEPGYHELGLPGGSERGLLLRNQEQSLEKPSPDLGMILGAAAEWLPGIIRGLQYLTPRLRLGGEVRILFGTGDAAQSAMLYGALNALNQTVQAVWPGKWKIFLGVNFSGRMLSGRIKGMIEFRAGHIMYAALIAAHQYAKGRIHSWINTPSKAL